MDTKYEQRTGKWKRMKIAQKIRPQRKIQQEFTVYVTSVLTMKQKNH